MSLNIHLLRHASTDEDKLIFKGVIDAPLSEKGKSEALALGGKLRGQNIKFDALYSSPLARAADTSALLGGVSNGEIIICPELTDINCGEWENIEVETVKKENPALFESWLKNPAGFTFPGGESVAASAARAGEFLKKIAAASKNGDIMVVTHRIIINLIVLTALEIDINKYWLFRYDNCRRTILARDKTGFYLKAMNID
jgi:probable phosphoglycerate mutase